MVLGFPMKEIEAKILEVDRNQVVQILTQHGGKRVFDGFVETILYDFKDGSIFRAKNLLRLRKENNIVELTYKVVSGTVGAKIAEEYTVEVSDLENAKKILGLIGLIVEGYMRKHRESYVLNGARFDIDKYNGKYSYIPEFLEIEAVNIKEIHNFALLLGFNEKDCLPWGTKELFEHYSK